MIQFFQVNELWVPYDNRHSYRTLPPVNAECSHLYSLYLEVKEQLYSKMGTTGPINNIPILLTRAMPVCKV